MCCAAGFLGGYRAGFQQGAEQYVAKRTTTVEYGLADVLTVHPDPEKLAALEAAARTVLDGEGRWKNQGGKAALKSNLDHISLILTHTDAAHKRLEGALDMYRIDQGLSPFGGAGVSRQFHILELGDLVHKPNRQSGYTLESLQAALGELHGMDNPRPEFWPRVYCSDTAHEQAKTFLRAVRKLKWAEASSP
jgi:hypothetical protein